MLYYPELFLYFILCKHPKGGSVSKSFKNHSLMFAALFFAAQGCFGSTDTLHALPGTGSGPILWKAQGATVGDDAAHIGGTASYFDGQMPNHRLFVPIADTTHTGTDVVYSVTVRLLARSDVDLRGTYDGIRVALKLNGTAYRDTAIDEIGTGYDWYTNTWLKNPATGSAWTWAEVCSLEAGAVTAKSAKPTNTIFYVDYIEMTVAYGPSTNKAPVASNVAATGTAMVGETMTGSYTYSDADNDPEGKSLYRWYRCDDTLGTNEAALSGDTTKACVLPVSTEGKYIFFEVTPIASTGAPIGLPARSAYIGSVAPALGSAPVAGSVRIDGIDTVKSTLVGKYSYSDAEGDAQGISAFRWLRNGYAIPGAVSSTYVLTDADTGSMIAFEVTPVAATGKPTTGTPVCSAPIGPIAQATGAAPQAANVAISGVDSVGKTLTGSYTYSDADGDAEGVSLIGWLRDGVPIVGAASKTYTLMPADEGARIAFTVIPVSATGTPSRGALASATCGPIAPKVGSAPAASNVQITGSSVPGNTLTGNYVFSDPDSDKEGASLYRWLRDGTAISGATGRTYVIKTEDAGANIAFEVTPVAATGVPKSGTAVTSAAVKIDALTRTIASGIARSRIAQSHDKFVNLLGRRVSGASAFARTGSHSTAGLYIGIDEKGSLTKKVIREK